MGSVFYNPRRQGGRIPAGRRCASGGRKRPTPAPRRPGNDSVLLLTLSGSVRGSSHSRSKGRDRLGRIRLFSCTGTHAPTRRPTSRSQTTPNSLCWLCSAWAGSQMDPWRAVGGTARSRTCSVKWRSHSNPRTGGRGAPTYSCIRTHATRHAPMRSLKVATESYRW